VANQYASTGLQSRHKGIANALRGRRCCVIWIPFGGWLVRRGRLQRLLYTELLFADCAAVPSRAQARAGLSRENLIQETTLATAF